MTQNQSPLSGAFDALRASIIVPDGYDVRPSSTIVWTPNRAGDLVALEMCANPIGISARARDRDGGQWSTRLEWLNPDGRRGELLLLAQQLSGHAGAVMDELTKRGVLFNPKALNHFRSYLFECQRDPSVPFERTVNHLGYTDALGESLPSFVLPDRVLRPVLPQGEVPSSERLFFQPTNPVASLQGYRSAGELSDWQAIVAPFGEHALIVIGTVLGLTGSFLKPAGEENGGIHFHGPTSSGKSSATQVAASVAGIPDNPSRGGNIHGLFQTWNTTQNAVEMLLAPHSGMTAYIDEVGANDAGVNLYNAFSGLGKARCTEIGGLREQNAWSVLVLSTGEYSLRDHIEHSDIGRVTDGTAVRMLDVPTEEVQVAAVCLGAEPLPPPEELATTVRALQAQLTLHHGTALPAFVERLFQHCHIQGVGLEHLIRSETKVCHQALCEEALASGFVLAAPSMRALNRLSLAAAVGKLAVELEVLPFTQVQVWRAVSAVRNAWLGNVQFLSIEDKIIEHLQNFCVANFQHVRIADHRANPPARGWPFFYFERQGLIVFTKDQLLCATGMTSLKAVTKALLSRGWLRTNEHNRADAKLLEEMKRVVPSLRAYQVLAEPVLGGFLRSVAPALPFVQPSLRQLSVAGDGVIEGDWRDSDEPGTAHRDDDPGPTIVMPQRRHKLSSQTKH